MPDALDALRQQVADLTAALAALTARVADLEMFVLVLRHEARERDEDPGDDPAS